MVCQVFSLLCTLILLTEPLREWRIFRHLKKHICITKLLSPAILPQERFGSVSWYCCPPHVADHRVHSSCNRGHQVHMRCRRSGGDHYSAFVWELAAFRRWSLQRVRMRTRRVQAEITTAYSYDNSPRWGGDHYSAFVWELWWPPTWRTLYIRHKHYQVI